MMADLREDAYNRLLGKVKPMVEQGLANPRDSPIPLNLLRTLSNAERILEEGKSVPGQASLYDGLAKWSKAISEASTMALLPFLYALSLHFSSRNGLRE